MSQIQTKDILNLVEKYRLEFPGKDRKFIRRLVLSYFRCRNIPFEQNSSDYRRLSRVLSKIDFKNLPGLPRVLEPFDKEGITIDGKEPEWLTKGWEWVDKNGYFHSYTIERKKLKEKL